MRPRRRYLPLVALFGAAVAVLPTVADSTESTPTVSAHYPYSWSPSEVAAKPSQTVAFQNSGEGLHGVIWETSDPETPTCENVPIGHGEATWSGTCTFSKEGIYEFECAVHRSLMTGRVYVNADGTVSTVTIKEPPPTTGTTTISEPPPPTTSTTKTTPPPTTTTGTTQAPATTAIAPPAATTAAVSTATPGPGSPPSGSPLSFGSALLAGSLKLTVPHRPSSVHVSVRVGQAGAGGSLAVDLLATEALLGKGKGSKQLLVGHLQRRSVSSGNVTVTVALTARAKEALARHHSLSLLVKIVLVPTQGATQTLTRSVRLHA